MQLPITDVIEDESCSRVRILTASNYEEDDRKDAKIKLWRLFNVFFSCFLLIIDVLFFHWYPSTVPNDFYIILFAFVALYDFIYDVFNILAVTRFRRLARLAVCLTTVSLLVHTVFVFIVFFASPIGVTIAIFGAVASFVLILFQRQTLIAYFKLVEE